MVLKGDPSNIAKWKSNPTTFPKKKKKGIFALSDKLSLQFHVKKVILYSMKIKKKYHFSSLILK